MSGPVNPFPYFDALLTSFEGYDWLPGLATSSVDRLVLHGAADGIPIEGARAWVRGFPNARLTTLSTSGHFPFLEQADATLSAIDLFLDGEWPAAAQTLQ
jgi:pimeloyl-ACP methyl ester carboxylesterase